MPARGGVPPDQVTEPRPFAPALLEAGANAAARVVQTRHKTTTSRTWHGPPHRETEAPKLGADHLTRWEARIDEEPAVRVADQPLEAGLLAQPPDRRAPETRTAG